MIIRPSSALRNEYNEIARICKEQGTPVFLTVNGREDTVILSVSEYEKLEKLELLYRVQSLGNDIAEGKTVAAEDVFAKLDLRLAALKSEDIK